MLKSVSKFDNSQWFAFQIKLKWNKIIVKIFWKCQDLSIIQISTIKPYEFGKTRALDDIFDMYCTNVPKRKTISLLVPSHQLQMLYGNLS